MRTINKIFLIGVLSTNIALADTIALDSLGFNAGYAKMFYEQENKKNPPSTEINLNDDFLNLEAYTTFTVFNSATIKPTINYILNINSEFTNHTLLMGVNKYFNFESYKLYAGALVGAGVLEWDYNPVGNTIANDYSATSFVGGLQVGAEYPLSDRLLLNINTKYLMHDYAMEITPSALTHTLITHNATASISIGLRFLFGEIAPYKPEAEQDEPEVEPKPKPEIDSDSDGVFDSSDKCPNTPIDSIVDDNGCIVNLSISMLKMKKRSTDATPTISGTVSPMAKSLNIEIKDRDNLLDIIGFSTLDKNASLDKKGNWRVDIPKLEDGKYSAIATANFGERYGFVEAEDNFEVDTTGPKITMLDIADFSQEVSPTIYGEVDSDAVYITIKVEDLNGSIVEIKEVSLSDNGNWSAKMSTLLDGKYRAIVTAIDDLDNISTATEDGFEINTGLFTLNIIFEKMSFVIREEYEEDVRKFAEYLSKFPMYKTEIKAYTCNSGSKKYNLRLSKKRAKAVYYKLIELGIDSSRMSHQGYGEDFPKVSNKTEEGRIQNRRIEAVVIKK